MGNFSSHFDFILSFEKRFVVLCTNVLQRVIKIQNRKTKARKLLKVRRKDEKLKGEEKKKEQQSTKKTKGEELRSEWKGKEDKMREDMIQTKNERHQGGGGEARVVFWAGDRPLNINSKN